MPFNIFFLFTKIGIFTIGGGYAVIPLIEKDIVGRKWITKDELYELITVTESLPGVFATNIAALVGYKINGFKGGLLAALGTIIAPFTIIICIAIFFTQFQDNIWVSKAFKALRPAVVALIVAPIFSVAKANNLSFKIALYPIAALLVMIFLKVSPVWVVIFGCFAGLMLSFRSKR